MENTEVQPTETVQPTEPAVAQPETVSKAELEKVLKDMHKYKNEAVKMKQLIEEQKTLKMKEQNQWKELAEAKEREAADALSKANQIQSSYVNEKKYNALLSKAQSLGLRPEAVSDLELLDLSDIQIETTSTGKINTLGADKFAERLKSIKPHWFAQPQSPNVNTSTQRVHDTPSVITPAMILAAEKEGKKTGDMSKYSQMFAQYQKQRNNR